MNDRSENGTTDHGSTSRDRRDILLVGVGLAAAALLAQRPADAAAQEAQKAKSGGEGSRASDTKTEQELLALSKEKWLWMSDRKVDSLDALFHEKAVFVHMGGTMSKAQELDVIKTGRIHYKHAEIQEASVRIVDKTAILLNRIRLLAVVGGNDVTNPFVVTEVYVQQEGKWTLASLSFTRLLGA